MRKMIAALLIAGTAAGTPAAGAAPQTTDCANVQYRQEHLADCNHGFDTWTRSGGGKGGSGGLLGLGIGPL